LTKERTREYTIVLFVKNYTS